MAFLEENEWMILNEITYNISFTYLLEDMAKELLDWIKQLIAYDGALFAVVDDENRFMVQIEGKGIKENDLNCFKKEFITEHPLSWTLASGNKSAYIESDFLSDEAKNKNLFLRKFYKLNNFDFGLGMNIVFQEEPLGIIYFYRKKGKEDFSIRDKFVLNQLQKHLAYRLSYEAKKGDTRYFYAKGYQERICREFFLTRRESEVLNLAVSGLSNEDIASVMNISIHTVKKHFHNLYNKMKVKNRVQLLQCLPLSTDKINYDEL